jgi:hypothetical protein
VPRPTGERKKKLERLSGTAEFEVVRRGTGGEHKAVVLHLGGGEKVILQRRGGNPFDDPETRRLVGHRVRVAGFRLDTVFRFVEAEVLDS